MLVSSLGRLKKLGDDCDAGYFCRTSCGTADSVLSLLDSAAGACACCLGGMWGKLCLLVVVYICVTLLIDFVCVCVCVVCRERDREC